MTDFLRVGAPRLDPMMDPSEEGTASRWIRQRAHELINTGVGVPNAFQQARADYAQVARRGADGHAVTRPAKNSKT